MDYEKLSKKITDMLWNQIRSLADPSPQRIQKEICMDLLFTCLFVSGSLRNSNCQRISLAWVLSKIGNKCTHNLVNNYKTLLPYKETVDRAVKQVGCEVFVDSEMIFGKN